MFEKKPHLRDGLLFLGRVPALGLNARIVDIGCGTGELLHRLHHIGFQNLTGIDPFLIESREKLPGMRLLACDLSQLQGEYDLLILNHSLEHVPEQLDAMQHVRRLLSSRGMAIVRVPLCDSLAWETYGVDWFQLDAPRHLYLHTVKSLTQLAAAAGLAVRQIVHDSDHHQFYVSERYRQDIPMLHDPQRPGGEPAKFRLGGRWRRQLAAQARALNREHRGDQATFYLSPVSDVDAKP
ncbi:MAG: class I SAM-dependent methyltransferase [Ideonella sp. MAG2]|nr:MAG: class I SAM-dependent methyltransferase [Ideonella sp. MAG2]